MVHLTDLFTWLVNTAAQAGAILAALSVIGSVVAAMTEELGWLFAGSAAGMLTVLIWLTGANAPMPSRYVLELLDD